MGEDGSIRVSTEIQPGREGHFSAPAPQPPWGAGAWGEFVYRSAYAGRRWSAEDVAVITRPGSR